MILEDYKFEKLDLYKTEILRKYIYSSENIEKYSCCPHCGHKHFISFGKYNGIQRYRCKSCKKTFSNSTNSLWKYVKHPPEKWIKFLELLGEKRTLEYCAEKLEISMVTAFNWRHKVLHALESFNKPKEFNDLIFMEMWYCRRNYKGSRNKHFVFRNSFYKRYNIATEDVYTAISYDVNDEIVIKNIGVCDKNHSGLNDSMKETFEKNIYSLCNKEAFIKLASFGCDPIYEHVRKHNKKVPIKKRKMYNYNPKSRTFMDNIECSSKTDKIGVQFMNWLSDFRGVATKYLNHYCSLFSLWFVEKSYDYIKLFFDLLSSSCSYTSIKSMNIAHPENY